MCCPIILLLTATSLQSQTVHVFCALDQSCTWTGVETFNNVAAINGAVFANQFASTQAAVNALPSTGGTVYFPCGYSGTGPTTGLSNVSLVSLCAPANLGVVGSFGISPNVTTTQVTLNYASCITFTGLQNFVAYGITFFQPDNCSMSLISSSFNWFIGDTLTGPNGGTGGTSTPAMILGVSNGSCGPGCNTIANHFIDFSIQCLNATGQYCNYAIQIAGAGAVNSGSVVSDNWFVRFITTGNVQNGWDSELNTDSNHCDSCFIHTDIPGGGSCAITYNQSTPNSDIDADANSWVAAILSPNFTNPICSGASSGNSYEVESASNFLSINVLGSVTPKYTAHVIGLFAFGGSYEAYELQVDGALLQKVANTIAGISACVGSTKAITLPSNVTYASQPVILVFDETTAGGVSLSTKSKTGFTVSCSGATDAFDWMVIANPN